MATVKYKRDFKQLEQRRRKGMLMLARGVLQAEVARQLGISRQTVSNWERAPGRSTSLAAQAAGQTGRHDRQGTHPAGQAARLGGDCLWLSHRAMDLGPGGEAHRARVRPRVRLRACVALAQAVGLLQPASGRPGHAAPRSGHRGVEGQALAPRSKKSPPRGAHHRLRRRIGTERAVHAGQNLGTQGPDPRA